MATNPRDPDTDDDGLTDFEEWRGFSPQTNPNHWDTDGDGIGDGVEITYGSDPTKIDTDGEGLFDPLEFLFNSDPNDTDTDDDGLSDYEEYLFNSSLINPDSDDDFMFDGYEKTVGTDPQNGDSDGDDLLDGHENLLGTNPLNGDTDGDKLTDGTEVMLWLNPISNDTDGDGLLDSTELEKGTNPFNPDTDGDGIPDSEDDDTFAANVDEIILAFDQNNKTSEFADKLAQYTNVTTVSVDELLLSYTNEPYIVIVGDPNGNGTAGQLVNSLLADCQDVLAKMTESDANRFAVRHGVWNETQTVVLLSQPYPQDHYRVLDILKGKIVTIQPDSAKVEIIRSTLVAYPEGGSLNHTALSYNFIEIAEIDTVKQTDSTVYAVLEQEANATVHLQRYSNSTTPFSLTHTSGLAANENAVGKYLEITVSENLQNQTSDIISEAYIQLYYRLSDLDMNSDGDADDPEDIREDTLVLYFFDESSQTWIKLSENLDWVINIGVNTTDVELYGESYAGYVWASLTYFSMYGIAGTPTQIPEETPRDLKEEALLGLEDLYNETGSYLIKWAKHYVSKSLKESLWMDDWHLTDEVACKFFEGKLVFNWEAKAIHLLEKALKKCYLTDEQKEEIMNIIDKLVKADRMLAQKIIEEKEIPETHCCWKWLYKGDNIYEYLKTSNRPKYLKSYKMVIICYRIAWQCAMRYACTCNSPPNVSNAHPSIKYLWPPNHKFVDVTIEGVTDPDGDEVTITIISITSDEPACLRHFCCCFDPAPDAYGIGTDTVHLRAERLGKGNGRVYEITFIANDGRGGETTGNVTVCVPHHKRKGTCNCIDDGQNYDATEGQCRPRWKHCH
jgi:hypothetical protein